MTTSHEKGPSNVDVTWEDQKKICLFGRLNQRVQEIERSVRAKTESVEAVNDASDEIFIANDSKFIVGECFVDLGSAEKTEDRLTRSKAKLERELQAYSEEVERIKVLMYRLKSELKVKFGESIHLEND
uniref:Prefoldin subunit 4 n=1 Tax=Paramoeba aestuarina TaxID=180227 RepID=A0A7S4NYY3_9EUKA|mmetsp:Transcript_33091/g.51733  ORF Transcript_33091/g.51733 Transcript_33091/m.51733 type:complete len:129 (+) Transcript_33091:19-405(+)